MLKDDKPSLRQRLQAGEIVLGSWLMASSAVNAEILADAGFDWLAADCEHSDTSIEQVTNMARAVQGRSTMLVRVRECDTLVIRQALDVGTEGVIVPLIETPEQAAHAVRAAKYPPQGVRGYSFGRSNDWGTNFDGYAAAANDRIVVIAMIESALAVENIDAILAVDGIDGVYIGPYDMSGSYGITGQTSHPKIIEARQLVLDACANAGKAAGVHVVLPTPESLRATIAEGFRFVGVGGDIMFLTQTGYKFAELGRQCREEL
jgi:2-keto-3-deoxy-L-rhamnonate aldolase RhmA